MKEKLYTFTQEQLEGFICYVLTDSLEHPNSTPKGTIRRLYQSDKKRLAIRSKR
jgi:hypothetical protein